MVATRRNPPHDTTTPPPRQDLIQERVCRQFRGRNDAAQSQFRGQVSRAEAADKLFEQAAVATAEASYQLNTAQHRSGQGGGASRAKKRWRAAVAKIQVIRAFGATRRVSYLERDVQCKRAAMEHADEKRALFHTLSDRVARSV